MRRLPQQDAHSKLWGNTRVKIFCFEDNRYERLAKDSRICTPLRHNKRDAFALRSIWNPKARCRAR